MSPVSNVCLNNYKNKYYYKNNHKNNTCISTYRTYGLGGYRAWQARCGLLHRWKRGGTHSCAILARLEAVHRYVLMAARACYMGVQLQTVIQYISLSAYYG